MKPVPSEPVNTVESMKRLTGAMRHILTVSKDELNKREAEYKTQSLANINRRGPKPKTSRAPAARPHA